MSDKRTAYHSELRRLIGGVKWLRDLFLGLGAGLATWGLRSARLEDVGSPELVDLLVAAGFVMSVEVVVFLYKFLYAAPFQLYQDQMKLAGEYEKRHEGIEEALRAENKGFRDELQKKRANRELAEALGREDDWAVHNLWANKPKTPAGFVGWALRCREWTERLVQILAEHDCPYLEIKSVRVLGDISEVGNYVTDPKLNHELRMLALRRERLQALIKKYSEE